DRIKPWKRSITGPHFLDHDAAVTGSENVNHPAGQDGLRKPACGLIDRRLLRPYRGNELSAPVQILLYWCHGNLTRAWLLQSPRLHLRARLEQSPRACSAVAIRTRS